MIIILNLLFLLIFSFLSIIYSGPFITLLAGFVLKMRITSFVTIKYFSSGKLTIVFYLDQFAFLLAGFILIIYKNLFRNFTVGIKD